MIHLTYDDTVRYLHEAVAERGADYVYTNEAGDVAYYVHTDKPGCIVGNVLHRAGTPLEALSLYEFTNAVSLFNGTYLGGDEIGTREPVASGEQSAIDLLTSVQSHQDNGTPWGEAVARALGTPSADGDDLV